MRPLEYPMLLKIGSKTPRKSISHNFGENIDPNNTKTLSSVSSELEGCEKKSRESEEEGL